MKKTIGIILIILSVNSMGSIFDWKVKKTENFEVFYHENYENKADEVLFFLEKYNKKIKKLTGNKRDQKTRIVLQDPGIITNGYADTMNTKISIYNNVPNPESELAGNNWSRLVGIHELIHINHLTNTSGFLTFMRYLYGNGYSPNVYLPLWVQEGITVYGESQLNEYDGRLNTGYYDAILDSKSSDKSFPSIMEMTYSKDGFPSGQQYLYGGGFTRYLARQYGEEKLGEFFNKYGKNSWFLIGHIFPFLGMDNTSKDIFGKSFPELLKEWKEYSYNNSEGWILEGEQLTKSYYDLSNLISYQNDIYYVQKSLMKNGAYDYRVHTEIKKYNSQNGKIKKLITIPSLVGRVESNGENLYFIEADVKSGFANVDQNGYGYIGALCKYNFNDKKKEKIFKDEIRAYTVLNNRIIYSKDKKISYGSEIWEYKDGKKKKLFEVNQLIGEIEVYKDKLITISKTQFGSWDISYLDLENQELKPLIESPRIESRMKVKGDRLYYTANYNKELSNYSYNFKNSEIQKLRSGSYGVDGIELEDKLYYIGLLSDGQVIYKADIKKERYKIKKGDIKKEDIKINSEEKLALIDNFKYLLKPNTRFNIFDIQGEDGIGFNKYNINPKYYYSKNYGWEFNFDINWESKILKPLNLSFNTDLNNFNITADLPIYNSLRYGLNDISLRVNTDFEDYYPGMYISFKLPKNRINNYIRFNKKGYMDNVNYKYLLNMGSLNLEGDIFDGYQKKLFITGFESEEINFKKGLKIKIDTEFLLVDIKKGLWNPNVFLGNMYGKIFSEYIKSANYNRLGNGIGIRLETGFGFKIPLVSEWGYSYSEEKGSIYYNFELGM